MRLPSTGFGRAGQAEDLTSTHGKLVSGRGEQSEDAVLMPGMEIVCGVRVPEAALRTSRW